MGLFNRKKRDPRIAPLQAVTATVERSGDQSTVSVGNRSFVIAGKQPGRKARENADFALFAIAAIGLVYNLKIEIQAPVTEQALRQVMELGRIWKTWMPSEFFPLRIEATTIVEPDTGSRQGGLICASGGIDSTYAMLHARRDYGFSHALLIDGTDYPNFDGKTLADLEQRVGRIARQVDLEPITVKTDIKKLMPWRWWNYFHTNILAMSLHYTGGGMAFGGYAADVPEWAEFILHPWGNNHVVARLFGVNDFPVHYLGVEADRTEKIFAIEREQPALLNHLSFCYQAETKPVNCGKCEKCIRTRLNLACAGLELPQIFKETPDLKEQIRRYEIPKDRYQRATTGRKLYTSYRFLPEGELRTELEILLTKLVRPLGGL